MRVAAHCPHRSRATTVPLLASLLLLLLCAVDLAPAAPARAVDTSAARAATLGVLDSIASRARGEGLRVWANGDTRVPVRIGDSVVYHFESERAAHLTVVHVDSHGLTTLLYPGPDADAGRLEPGRPRSFPPEGAGFELVVEPPVGIETLFAVASDAPIARSALVAVEGTDPVVVIDPEGGTAVARRLAALLSARAPESYAVATLRQEIQGRRGDTQYRAADIEGFFAGSRTRSIEQPSLDLHIGFATDSSDLDPDARRNLDEVVRAFASPRLAAMHFAVRGHTDDRGPADYNVDLSRRRAQAVEDYLVEKGIERTRLTIEAHGENQPLEPGTSERARRLNRRVDFQLKR